MENAHAAFALLVLGVGRALVGLGISPLGIRDPLDDGGGAAGVNAGVGLRGSPAFSLCAVFLLISQRGRAGPRGFFLRHHRVLWNNRSGPVPVRWDLLSRRRGVYI